MLGNILQDFPDSRYLLRPPSDRGFSGGETGDEIPRLEIKTEF
jgi:hypothetical protein